MALIVNGFCREVMEELPMEFAVEAQEAAGHQPRRQRRLSRARNNGIGRCSRSRTSVVEVDGKQILNGLSLSVGAGEVHAIMGPNGSGKSTLAYVLAGREGYEVTAGSVTLDGQDLLEMAPGGAGGGRACSSPCSTRSRSRASPTCTSCARRMNAHAPRARRGRDRRRRVHEAAAGEGRDRRRSTEALLKRDLNVGFSGGEKKRNEILQMAMLEPRAGDPRRDRFRPRHRRAADGRRWRQRAARARARGMLVITHYQRLLDYIVPDQVHVLADGRIRRVAAARSWRWSSRKTGYAGRLGASSPTSRPLRAAPDHGRGRRAHRAGAGLRRACSRTPAADCPARCWRGWRRAQLRALPAAGLPDARAPRHWKYTNVAPKCANVPMALAPQADLALDDDQRRISLGGPKARRLIFVNGHVVPELSHVGRPAAGHAGDEPGRALEDEPDARGALALARADGTSGSFTALNAAFAGAGSLDRARRRRRRGRARPAAVPDHWPAGTGDEPPAHRGPARHRREAAADREPCRPGRRPQPDQPGPQIDLGAGAQLEHDRVQLGDAAAATSASRSYAWAPALRLSQTVATLGGALVATRPSCGSKAAASRRCSTASTCRRPGACRQPDPGPPHAPPAAIRPVLQGRRRRPRARRVRRQDLVHKDAQKTNAYQNNDNLLLSDDAEIDTKPELEIYADDVKCSHGATVGDLDPHGAVLPPLARPASGRRPRAC